MTKLFYKTLSLFHVSPRLTAYLLVCVLMPFLLMACIGKAPLEATSSDAGKSIAISEEAMKFKGVWRGDLQAGPQILKLIITVTSENVFLDVPAQNIKAYPSNKTEFTADGFKADFAAFKSSFSAKKGGDGFLDGVWTQGGADFSFKLLQDDSNGAAEEEGNNEQRRGEAVRFSSADSAIELAGTLLLPEADDGPYPAAVLITGSGPQNRDEALFGLKPFQEIAEALEAAGWASLRYDDRGVGESGGVFAGSVSADFALDAVGAYRFLVADKRIDPERVILIGHSEGSYVACLAENEIGGVHALFLLGGMGISGYELLLQQSEDLLRASAAGQEVIAMARAANKTIYDLVLSSGAFPREAITAELKQAGLPDSDIEAQMAALSDPWFKAFLSSDPQSVLKKVRSPVFAMTGSKDLQVRASTNLAGIAAAASAVPVKTVELEGLNHVFQKAITGLPTEYGSLGVGIDKTAIEQLWRWLESL